MSSKSDAVRAPRCRRPGVRALSWVLAGLLAACGGPPAGAEGEAPLITLIAAAEGVPYSENHTVAIVKPDRVCVVASYEAQVHCGDRDWREVDVIGQSGSGPGEFRQASNLVPGPAGTLGVIDHALQRMSIFDAEARLQHTVALPFLFRPLAPFDSVIAGVPSSLPSFAGGPATRSAGSTYQVVSIATGQVLSEMALVHPVEERTGEPRALWAGARSDLGELAFLSSREIVRFTAEGEVIEAFLPPLHVDELPNERDIEEFMGAAFLGARPSDAAVQEFRSEPKRYAVRGGRSVTFDDRGRLWVMTQRDRDQSSWLDVYRAGELLGSVRVRDRILGFDVHDDLLAVLVERRTLTREGLPVRAIDWYEVR
jgi:hypothetical protein